MLKLPLVTFVVTSYNYEKYILKTIESIKAQTYKNTEIIVVDDYSTDNSYKLLEQVSDIKLIKNEQNLGQLASMLKGLELAQGQFISFIDSDDVLMPDYAQNHIRAHLQTSVAFTSCQIIEIGGWHWSPNSSAMFRKASIELMLNYKNTDAWRICPDKFLFNFAHLIGGSAIINKPLIGYRRHNNNAGNCTLVTGNKKLHSDKTTLVNIQNNLKIRPETIKFLWQERKNLGYRNTLNLIFKIL